MRWKAATLVKRILKAAYRNIYVRHYGLTFGGDLHSHIRWRAIRYLLNRTAEYTLEVGCGNGLMLFELYKHSTGSQFIGIDINERAISKARRIAAKRDMQIEFYNMDAQNLSEFNDGSFDQLLLIDVIEHVLDDRCVLMQAGLKLKRGGTMIISVPTPHYPRFFGREFHNEIGHVRDGYWIHDIEKMASIASLRVKRYYYCTLLPSSVLCAFFYRYLRRHPVAMIALSPVLNVLSLLDQVWPWNTPACSLSVQLVKE